LQGSALAMKAGTHRGGIDYLDRTLPKRNDQHFFIYHILQRTKTTWSDYNCSMNTAIMMSRKSALFRIDKLQTKSYRRPQP